MALWRGIGVQNDLATISPSNIAVTMHVPRDPFISIDTKRDGAVSFECGNRRKMSALKERPAASTPDTPQEL
jgi:hypothetical protein